MPRLNRLLFKSGSKGQAGFTLIEVLIAITIFAIGLLAIAGMQLTAIQTNSSASEITARAALAEGILEEILTRPGTDGIFSNHTSNLATHPNPDDWEGGNIDIPGAGIFRAFHRVAVDQPDVGMSTVVVTVQNTVGRNIDRTTVFTGIKRR